MQLSSTLSSSIEYFSASLTLVSGGQATVQGVSYGGKKTPSSEPQNNEDRIFVSPSIMGVFDGATAVIPGQLDNLTPGAWVAEQGRQFLEVLARDSSTLTAKGIIHQLNRAIREALSSRFPEMWKALPLGPSATGAIVSIAGNGTLTYAAAGDCVILVEDETGIRLLTRDLVSEGEQQLFGEAARTGSAVTVEAHHARRKARYNKVYAVINGDEVFEAENQLLQTGSLALQTVRRIILLSDGMGYPGSLGDEYVEAVKYMITHGVEAYVDHLVKIYNSDPMRKTFPRGKHYDDASIIMVELR